jgi:RNA polymerase sigma-70 factor (ECF subfamily)
MPAEIADRLVALLPRLYRYARVLARADALVDDLVQSACERALAAERGPLDGVPFDAWMLRIVRNLWLDQLRRYRSEGTVVDIDDAGELPAWSDRIAADTAEVADRRQTLARVRIAIDRLPEDQREVLLLVCGEGLSYRAAAALLEVPIGTVMSRLARARARLAALTASSAGAEAAAGGISRADPRIPGARAATLQPASAKDPR